MGSCCAKPVMPWEGVSTLDKLIIQILLFTDAYLPWHKAPGPLALIYLILRRSMLRKYNLHWAAGRAHPELGDFRFSQKFGLVPPNFRTPSGRHVDETGASKIPFNRNTVQIPRALRKADEPPAQQVAQELLAREGEGQAAGRAFNMLAAAWIQFNVHDWFDHRLEGSAKGSLNRGGEFGCPMRSFKFPRTEGGEILEERTGRPTGLDYYVNERTSWWDSSVVYGNTPAQIKRTRTYRGGRVVDPAPGNGFLPTDPATGLFKPGDQLNSYLGVSLLQLLFLKEHNLVAARVARAHPDWSDEAVFRCAQLTVSAIQTKIHTIDWTVVLLATPVLKTAMYANWYGLLGRTVKETFGLHTGVGALSGLAGLPKPLDQRVAYSLTEDFCTVYRLHPLVRDELLAYDVDAVAAHARQNKGAWPPPRAAAALPVEATFDEQGVKLAKEGMKAGAKFTDGLWLAFGGTPSGTLSLRNYPKAFRDAFHRTDPAGKREAAHPFDMAALEIHRDRSRGVPRYNEFRRQLFLAPIKAFSDLTDDPDTLARLTKVYGKDVEAMDTIVGLFAEWGGGKKTIPGFLISETAFHIFIVMASMRIDSDPMYTTYFNEETYSKEGFARIKEVQGLKDLLKAHFPAVAAVVRPESAFNTWSEADPSRNVCVAFFAALWSVVDLVVLTPLKLVLACFVCCFAPCCTPPGPPHEYQELY